MTPPRPERHKAGISTEAADCKHLRLAAFRMPTARHENRKAAAAMYGHPDAATARQVINDTFAEWRSRHGDTMHDWTGLAGALLANFRAAGFPLTLPPAAPVTWEGLPDVA